MYGHIIWCLVNTTNNLYSSKNLEKKARYVIIDYILALDCKHEYPSVANASRSGSSVIICG